MSTDDKYIFDRNWFEQHSPIGKEKKDQELKPDCDGEAKEPVVPVDNSLILKKKRFTNRLGAY